MRARRGDMRCPGDDEPGLTTGAARSRARHRILDSLPLPTGARELSQENRACPFAPSSMATDFARMHLLAAVKGLSVRSCSAPPRRKQAEGRRDPAPSRARKRSSLTNSKGDEKAAITSEDTRVAECDLIMCRVASSRRRESNPRRTRDEGAPGRGSSVPIHVGRGETAFGSRRLHLSGDR